MATTDSTDSTDDVYSPSAREMALSQTGNRALGGVGFQATLLTPHITEVCGFLKGIAKPVIDKALEFDAHHAESRLLEIDGHPEREVPNPYSIENQESTKTIVRIVLSSALELLSPWMASGWVESTWPKCHLDGAERALIGRLDQEYPRLRVDFESRVQARRNAAVRPSSVGSEVVRSVPSTEEGQNQEQGNGKVKGKGKSRPSGRSMDVKLIAALSKHHGYDDGYCSNDEPIGSNELARAAKVGKTTSFRFFKRQFKSYDAYKQTCRNRGKLGQALKALNGEVRPRELRNQFDDARSTVPMSRTNSGTPDDDIVMSNGL